jgi:hypothetical protein
MRTGSWTYGLTAQCRLDAAVNLLSDVTKQGRLHPLIVEVNELPPGPGALRSFAIKDRLRIAGLPLTITYLADLLMKSDKEVVTVARQRPRTTLRNVTRFQDNGDGTIRVDVEVTLTAAHRELAERMQQVLENS